MSKEQPIQRVPRDILLSEKKTQAHIIPTIELLTSMNLLVKKTKLIVEMKLIIDRIEEPP